MITLLAAALILQASGAPDTAVVPSAANLASLSPPPGDILSRVLQSAEEPQWSPGMPPFGLRVARSRYNRIEGLSLAGVAGKDAGNGYTLALLGRLGTADLQATGDLEVARERGFRKHAMSAYHRLVAANDWGNPLALGASLGALFIGRDEGFYYRTSGVEYRMVDSTRESVELRLFAERQRSARVKNDFSIADMFGDRDFRGNFVARKGSVAGASAIITMRRGVDTIAWRFFGEVKAEVAAGDFTYARGMTELIFAQPLLRVAMASLAVSGGTSGGELPPQRSYFLGGQRSLRGQRPGVMAGDAFWMTQLELGTPNVFARPVLFFDAGWAGSREDFSRGRIATGAGIGGSFFDGSLRFDLARGMWPGTGVRGALYLEGRF